MIQAFKAVLDATPTERFVGWVLADCHNDLSGQCDPTVAYLMRVTGFSNRTIATALAGLEKAGHLTAIRRNGSHNHYRMHPKSSERPSLVEMPSSEPPSRLSEQNQCSSFTGCQNEPVNLLHSTSEPPSKSSEPPSKSSEPPSHKPEEPIEPEGTNKRAQPRKREDGPDLDFEAAKNVTLGLMSPPEVQRLWSEFQGYRTERHSGRGEYRLAWTERAARMSAEAVNRAVIEHGEQIVCDRIRAAISGSWKGLNFDKLEPAKKNGTPHSNDHPRGAQRFGAFSAPSPKAQKSGRV